MWTQRWRRRRRQWRRCGRRRRVRWLLCAPSSMTRLCIRQTVRLRRSRSSAQRSMLRLRTLLRALRRWWRRTVLSWRQRWPTRATTLRRSSRSSATRSPRRRCLRRYQQVPHSVPPWSRRLRGSTRCRQMWKRCGRRAPMQATPSRGLASWPPTSRRSGRANRSRHARWPTRWRRQQRRWSWRGRWRRACRRSRAAPRQALSAQPTACRRLSPPGAASREMTSRRRAPRHAKRRTPRNARRWRRPPCFSTRALQRSPTA
mmetsp:Transcript_15914/g.47167  ORF Transcript_15914/g.47167 Transcript_15914/m.47167 type:complete len:259 (+) Transcript_15914:3744-4520(+)